MQNREKLKQLVSRFFLKANKSWINYRSQTKFSYWPTDGLCIQPNLISSTSVVFVYEVKCLVYCLSNTYYCLAQA